MPPVFPTFLICYLVCYPIHKDKHAFEANIQSHIVQSISIEVKFFSIEVKF